MNRGDWLVAVPASFFRGDFFDPGSPGHPAHPLTLSERPPSPSVSRIRSFSGVFRGRGQTHALNIAGLVKGASPAVLLDPGLADSSFRIVSRGLRIGLTVAVSAAWLIVMWQLWSFSKRFERFRQSVVHDQLLSEFKYRVYELSLETQLPASADVFVDDGARFVGYVTYIPYDRAGKRIEVDRDPPVIIAFARRMPDGEWWILYSDLSVGISQEEVEIGELLERVYGQ